MSQAEHRPVLLREALRALAIRPDGRYLDATFGRGGHSGEILRQLGDQGRLLAIDKDPAALACGQELEGRDPRFVIRQGSFAAMARILAEQGWGAVDGVLMDLGVSSPQLDQAERGFSFQNDGPLDMRMNPEQGESAAAWLNRATEREVAGVLREFGEERFAGRIAAAICRARASRPILRTGQLADLIRQAHPAWEKGRHPATKSFQGIRIHVNRELEDLGQGLAQAITIIRQGGLLVVISFHSLEDRMVKRFIRDQARGDVPAGVPVTSDRLARSLRPLGGAVHPASDELAANPRARSAVLRAAERL